MRREAFALACVSLSFLLASGAEASPRPAVGSLGPSAGTAGDLPRVAVPPSELNETTGGAALLPVSNLRFLNPGDVVDGVGNLAGCLLDPITGIPDDPTNLVTGPAKSVGCVAKEATGPVGDVVENAASGVANGIADQWTKAVLEGTSWLLRSVATAIDKTTSPNLGAAWFRGAYDTMGAIALLVVVPLLFFSLATALVHRDAGKAIKSALVSLPMAFVLSACALTLTQLGVAITDWACAAIAQSVDQPGGAFLASTSKLVSYDTLVGGTNKLPTFVALGAGLLAFLCAVVVWLEFIIRDAAVYLSAFFLPLAFAGAVWPRTARASRRIVGLLAVVVFSKFVIVAVLSLAGRAAFAGVPEEGIEPLLASIAMLLLAVMAPAALVGLVPLLDEDGGHDGLRRGVSQGAMRLPVPGPGEVLRNVARTQAASTGASRGGGAGGGGGGAGGGGAENALMAMQTAAGQSKGRGGPGSSGPSIGESPGGSSSAGTGSTPAPTRAAEQAVAQVTDIAEGRGVRSPPLRRMKPTEAEGPRSNSEPAHTAGPASPPPPEAQPPSSQPETWSPGDPS